MKLSRRSRGGSMRRVHLSRTALRLAALAVLTSVKYDLGLRHKTHPQRMRVVANKSLDASTITRRPTRKARVSSGIGVSPTESSQRLWSESPTQYNLLRKKSALWGESLAG